MKEEARGRIFTATDPTKVIFDLKFSSALACMQAHTKQTHTHTHNLTYAYKRIHSHLQSWIRTHSHMHAYTGSKGRSSFLFVGRLPCKTKLKGVVFLFMYLYSTCLNERKEQFNVS